LTSTTAESTDDAFSLRLARAEDLPSILQIEHNSHSAAHWPERDYQQAIAQAERLVLVAEKASELLGFLVASTATKEWELENIAVAPAVRRRGVGRALMLALIVSARQAKAAEIRQEIRASNTVAQQLGQSVGFVQEGRRRDYYCDPTEDALLFKYLVVEPKSL
jgi:ribosomal-protein-alanine N-acetyltransferase